MQFNLWLNLDRNQPGSLHMQIYLRIRQAILQGSLAQGARLPSTRSLASELNVSRGTVEVAFEILSGEGLLQGKGPAGTFVTSAATFKRNQGGMPKMMAIQHPDTPHETQPESLKPLHPCVPAFDLFPIKLWTKLMHKRMRATALEVLANGNHAGYWPLRVSITNYLQISRGVTCSPEQVFITRGFQGALDMITRTILDIGDGVVVEDPGYRYARNLFLQAKMNVSYAPVDSDGIDIDWIEHTAKDTKLIAVTPSHQSPTGVTLSIARRIALLALAKKQNVWVLEDDYDSEYRYVGRPLPSLKSLDIEDRVIYAGTFSKVLFPALRTGYLVVPKSLIPQFEETAQIYQSGCPNITQMVIYDFMNDGHFSRHIKKMRSHYSKRRQWLINALNDEFRDNISIELQKSGMHLIVLPNIDVDDITLALMAREAGFGIHALSEWSVHTSRKGLLIGFTNITSPESASALALRLKTTFSS